MKVIKLAIVFFVGLISTGFGQAKTVQKIVISTPTVQCEMCKTKIEKFLTREPGISDVNVNFKKKTTTVTFLTDRNNIEQIKIAIANAGYDADDVTADEDAYKKLPKCCKKPSEKEEKVVEKKN